MKVFITGGAGFIGHHLSRRLLKSGHSVVSLDNLSTGSKANVSTFLNNSNYQFAEGDARNEELVRAIIEKTDVVFNLAASVGVKKIFEDPIDCIENNTAIGSVILKVCSEFNRRLFMFSTSEIYGKTECFPFGESADITLGSYDKLRWSYACSKVMDDFLSRAYFVKRGLPVTMVRLFNTIGAYQVGQYGMVVPRLMNQALANTPLTIYGSGEQTRCFTDVRDVVRALELLIDCPESYGELINIGTSHEISIQQLANKIIEVVGSRSDIEFISYEDAYGAGFEDMNRRVASTLKLQKMLKFDFKYTLVPTLQWIMMSLGGVQKSTWPESFLNSAV